MTAIETTTLLIVEDNEVQREGLATVLEDCGYYLRQASNGQQMRLSLRQERPDLILLDMLLPDSRDDGWALLSMLQHNPEWASIPVIIVTAIGVASEQWARSLGAVTFLHKPFFPEELRHKISAYLPKCAA